MDKRYGAPKDFQRFHTLQYNNNILFFLFLHRALRELWIQTLHSRVLFLMPQGLEKKDRSSHRILASSRSLSDLEYSMVKTMRGECGLKLEMFDIYGHLKLI